MSGGHGHSGPSIKSLYLIFGSTFLFGFVSGIILFLLNTMGNDTMSVRTDRSEFAVIAYMYGGCARSGECSSYRISEDGSYTYLVRNLDDEQVRADDSLSRSQITTLRNQLRDTPLDTLSKTEFTGTCPADFDGLGYRYDVEYQGESYTFDTCVENLENEPLFATLQKYFELFALVHTE